VPHVRPRWSPGFLTAAIVLALAIALTAVDQPVAGPSHLTSPAVRLAKDVRQEAAYYRPVIADGKAFPVARSNYLSYLEFPNSWHAPRLRFVDGRWRLIGVHEGIDIMAERGTPIISMAPGVVENVGWTFYSGTRVGVRGTDGRYYFYAHLSKVQPGISVGAAVSAGTVLGLIGNTGYGAPGHRDEFPPHLHFGIEVGSEWVDPYPSLVMLYAATVRTTERWQANLDRLARAGKSEAWTRAAAGAYMSLPPA
jgi:murein DD-endopeptidase MepM/ murein hydrolase activator NlpD